MAICIKCGIENADQDPKTICSQCVERILKGLSVQECMDLAGDVATKVRRGQERWKAKHAGNE
jgi:hypothetical protein